MYTAEEIRIKQDKLNDISNKRVDEITHTIYNLICENPEKTEYIIPNTIDKSVSKKLQEIGYQVEDFLGGAYADAWWTKITWNK